MTASTPETIRIPGALRGDLATIHRSEGPLAELLAEIPDWRTAAKALIELEATRPGRFAADQTVIADAVAQQLLGHLLAGQPAPDDLAAYAAERQAEIECQSILSAAYTRATNRLTSMLDEAVRDAEDELYAGLNDRLQTIVAEARTIDDFGGLADANRVLATGRSEDRARWEKITGDYQQIRTAQSRLTKRLTGLDGTHEALALRDVEQVFPEWRAWRQRGFQVDASDRRRTKYVTPPWPFDPQFNRVLRLASEASTPEFLAWAIASGANLWVPTTAEFNTEAQRLAELARNPDAETTSSYTVTDSPPDTDWVDPDQGPQSRRVQPGGSWLQSGARR